MTQLKKKQDRLQFENIFEVVSSDKAEVADLTYRADLILALREYFKVKGLTQKQIGELLNIPQPRVSELLNGRINLLSASTLNTYLAKIGYRVGIMCVTGSKKDDLRFEACVIEF